MLRQMFWLPALGSNGQKILYLRTNPNQPWQPYTAFPLYKVPDYNIPQGSKGWATYQKLMKANWTLIASAEGLQELSSLEQGVPQSIAS